MNQQCECPSCRRTLSVPDGMFGTQVQCPLCGSVFIAWAGSAAGGPAPPSSEAIQSKLSLDPAASAYHLQEQPDAPVPPHPHLDDEYAEFRARRTALPQYGELPGGGLATAVMVLLGLSIFVDLGALAFDAVLLQKLPQKAAQPQQNQNDDELDLAELFANPMECLQPCVYLPAVVVFCCWIYRAYKNLSLLNVQGLQHSPGWAVGYFFIPILNLFRPCQVAQEMWRASDPDAPVGHPDAWCHSCGSAVIGLWSTFWLLTNILSQIAFRLAWGGRADEKAILLVSAAADAVSVPAALFAIAMIKGIRDRQTEKFQRLRGEAVAP